MTRVLYWTVAVVIGIASGALVSCTAVTVPTGSHGIRALEDPEVIARGRYLVRGPAHCAACHGDPSRDDERRRGVDIPLSGGRAFPLGLLGTIVAPNITSDPAAGIGALSDATLVRACATASRAMGSRWRRSCRSPTWPTRISRPSSPFSARCPRWRGVPRPTA